MAKPSHDEREKYGETLYDPLEKIFPSVEMRHFRDGNDLVLSLVWGSGEEFRQIEIRILWEALDDFLLKAQNAEPSRVKLLKRFKEISRDVKPVKEEQKFRVTKDDLR